ncbi:hypothetical protein ABPG75_009395 [Micractinium tetrahymenae]
MGPLKPASAEDGGTEIYNRRCACFALEVTAALAALQPYTAAPTEDDAPNVPAEWFASRAARARTLRMLAVCRGADADACSASPVEEAALLQEVAAGYMVGPGSAALLAPLLQRLLPPLEPQEELPAAGSGAAAAGEQAAGCSSAAGSEAAALLPLPLEAAIFQARALATRRCCAHLGCPFISAGSTDDITAPPKAGKKCAACMALRFCGKACARAAWPAHRAACHALAAERAAAAAGEAGPA